MATAGEHSREYPVAIIGGGVAGIAAAIELSRSHTPSLLLESRTYLGGRVRSFIHEETGDEIDNGQHFLMGCYHETLRLLETLGTRNQVRMQSALHVDFVDAQGRQSHLHSSEYLPAPLNLLVALLGFSPLSFGERTTLTRVPLAIRKGDVQADETVSRFLSRHQQSDRACELLWYPLAIATLNTAPELASATLFGEVLGRAFLSSKRDASLAYATVGLSELLVPTATCVANAGGEVRTSATVRTIERVDSGYTITLSDGEHITTRSIIAALPAKALRRVLKESELDDQVQIPEQLAEHSPIVSLYLWYDDELRSVPEFCALTGTHVQWLFNRRKMCAARNENFPGLLSCTISAADMEAVTDTSTLAHLADSELRRVLPEIQNARLLASQVIKEKEATFSATPVNEKLRPDCITALPNFYLAGDWTNTGLPATIEGAVASGVKAARLLRAGIH